MKTEYQTISFAGITLSPDAQIAIKSMQEDEEKIICDNLTKIALRLSKEYIPEKASETLGFVHSLLLARDFLSAIGEKGEDE